MFDFHAKVLLACQRIGIDGANFKFSLNDKFEVLPRQGKPPSDTAGRYKCFITEKCYIKGVLVWNWEGEQYEKVYDAPESNSVEVWEDIRSSEKKVYQDLERLKEWQYNQSAIRVNKLCGIAQCEFGEHGYLQLKKIGCHNNLLLYSGDFDGIRYRDTLLIPLYRYKNGQDELVNVQKIYWNNKENEYKKRYFLGAQKKGCYFPIGTNEYKYNDDIIFIAEGLATATSIFEAFSNQYQVIMGLDAGNLIHVAKVFKDKFPNSKIVICADNDPKDNGTNPGVEAAKDAAGEVSGLVAVCPLIDGRAADFNDLTIASGHTVVKQSLEKTIVDNNICQTIKKNISYVKDTNDSTQNIKAVSILCRDFLAMDIPPKEPILKPIFFEKEIGEIFATRGAGKTMFAMQMAVSIAGGINFCRFEVPKPRKVLYVDGEMPLVLLKSRVIQAINSSETPNIDLIKENLTLINPDLQPKGMLNLSTPPGRNFIWDICLENDVIFLDSYLTLAAYGDLNDARSFTAMQELLLDLRSKGKSIIFLHHAGKSGKQLGTVQKETVLDLVIGIENIKEDDKDCDLSFRLFYDKHRSFLGDDSKPLLVTLHKGKWSMVESKQWEDEKILELYNLGMSQTAIAQELGVNQSTVSRVLKRNGIETKRKKCVKLDI